jgi:hypothetical protein
VGLNELGPTNVQVMKHNENDIGRQKRNSTEWILKTCKRGSRQYQECCKWVIVHQSGSEVKYQQKQMYHENKYDDLGINGKKVSLYLIISRKTQGEITYLAKKNKSLPGIDVEVQWPESRVSWSLSVCIVLEVSPGMLVSRDCDATSS